MSDLPKTEPLEFDWKRAFYELSLLVTQARVELLLGEQGRAKASLEAAMSIIREIETMPHVAVTFDRK